MLRRSLRVPERWPVLLIALATLLVVAPWFHAPLSFDEGYNLQVVRNLVQGHGYATDGALYGGHLTPFDYQVTTGPTLLFPVAGVVAVLGAHVWVYRLVPVGVTLGLVVAWFVLVRRHGGTLPAAAAAATLLMMDNAAFPDAAHFGPGSVLGENTSVLLLVLAALTLPRPALAGLSVGLAVMTKLVVLFAVPGVLLGIVLVARRRGESDTSAAVRFMAGVVVPAVAWQVYRVVAVGSSGAWKSDQQSYDYFTHNGSSGSAIWTAPVRILEQIAVLGVTGAVALVLALGLVAAAVVRGGKSSVRRLPPDVLSLAVAGLTLEARWVLVEAQGWPRHSTQASELLMPLVAAAATLLLVRSARGLLPDVLRVGLPLLAAVQVGVTVHHGWDPPGPSLADQRLVAQHVESFTHDFVFPNNPQAFELSVLAPVQGRSVGPAGGILVQAGNEFGPADTSICDRILYERAGYVVCRVDPKR